MIRLLSECGFTGPILSHVTALTRLAYLYALRRRAVPQPILLCYRHLWHRSLRSNRFTGSVPSAISVLTAVTFM